MGSQVSFDKSAPPRRDRSDQPGPSRTQILAGPYSYEERSDAEKMTKREREENGLARFTAYATAEGYRLKMLQAFLRREHGVGVVRVYDDCIYAVSDASNHSSLGLGADMSRSIICPSFQGTEQVRWSGRPPPSSRQEACRCSSA